MKPALQTRCTAFGGSRRIAAGELADVALKAKAAADQGEPVAIFDDTTSEPIELDFRGTDADVLRRLTAAGQAETPPPAPAESRGPGRPKLGVVPREVTLLPRHWEWLNAQPGGASVALRKLVEEARRANGDRDRQRAARDAAYHFMSAMAGNLRNFEEASRALSADDRPRFSTLIASWPPDIREHVVKLAYGDHAKLSA